MVRRADVLTLVEAGVSYEDAAARLGIHPGLAYMIATGRPADGSDGLTDEERKRPGFLSTTTVHLANPVPVHNPTHHDEVARWTAARVWADRQMQRAGAGVPAPPELGAIGNDADVVAVMTRDHGQFHELSEQLEVLPTKRKGASTLHLERRGAAVDAIRQGLVRHEEAEEHVFWPLVRQALDDGATLSENGCRQEQEAAELLRSFAGIGPGDDEFDELVQKLRAALRKHVAFEERVCLALSGVTGRVERVEAGEKLAEWERNRDAGT
jgi:hypothetical protein